MKIIANMKARKNNLVTELGDTKKAISNAKWKLDKVESRSMSFKDAKQYGDCPRSWSALETQIQDKIQWLEAVVEQRAKSIAKLEARIAEMEQINADLNVGTKIMRPESQSDGSGDVYDRCEAVVIERDDKFVTVELVADCYRGDKGGVLKVIYSDLGGETAWWEITEPAPAAQTFDAKIQEWSAEQKHGVYTKVMMTSSGETVARVRFYPCDVLDCMVAHVVIRNNGETITNRIDRLSEKQARYVMGGEIDFAKAAATYWSIIA